MRALLLIALTDASVLSGSSPWVVNDEWNPQAFLSTTDPADSSCPLQHPVWEKNICTDLPDFNASVGKCVCSSSSCGIRALGVLSTDSLRSCAHACQISRTCAGFEGYYIGNSSYGCMLYSTERQEDGSLKMLSGDRKRHTAEKWCYSKPLNGARCSRYSACLPLVNQKGHFCCPDRSGDMLSCCHSPGTVQAFGSGCLVLLLIFSMYYNLRGWCKPAVATPASLPGTDDIRFPRITGVSVTQEDFLALVDGMNRSGRFLIAFVNPGSGDQSGQTFETLFSALLSDYGRVCKLPADLDSGFKLAAEMMQKGKEVVLLACGGDGTVTWVLSEVQRRKDTVFSFASQLPAVGIVPLGTGNDLARSLGWGPALTANSELLDFIWRAIEARPVLLDQWSLKLRPNSLLPPALRPREGSVEFVGYFTNYFSIGMDAQTAYEVARAREGGLGKCCFRTRCFRPCSFIHGGALCYALNAPNCARCWCCRTRALSRDLEVRFDNQSEPATFDSQFRQFSLTNLNSYGAGMLLFGREATIENVSPNDGKLEVFVRQNPSSVIWMTMAKKLLKARCGNVPIARQVQQVEMKLSRGQYFQMDGEPWVLNSACTAVVEPNVQVRMLCPSTSGRGAGIWGDQQERSFWSADDGAVELAHQSSESSPGMVL